MASARRALGKALLDHHRLQRPEPQFFKDMDELKARVRQVVARSMNHCILEFYGSIRSGFVHRSSDIDLALTWQTFDPLLVGNQRFDDLVSRKLKRVAEGAAQEGMEGVRLIDCRYPAVQWVDPALEQLVDVGVGNVSAVENSRMLRLICDVHPIIATYVHCIKTWAKAKELIAPDKGTMNSFTLTSMALMVLQELGVLPVFGATTGNFTELTVADVERAVKGFKLPAIYANMKESDDDMMAECIHFLLSKFAEYYAAFDFKQGTVSLIVPRRARQHYREVALVYTKLQNDAKKARWEAFHKEQKFGAIDLEDLADSLRAEEGQRVADTAFVVEDLANYDNCGRRVMKQRVEPLMKEIHQLKDMMMDPALTIDKLYAPTNRFQKIFNDDKSQGRVKHFS